MKSGKTLAIAVGALFILVIGILAAGYFFYNSYKIKIDYLEEQNQESKDKILYFEKNIDSFNTYLDNFNTQFKKYSEDVKEINGKINLAYTEKDDMLSKINNISKEIEILKESSTKLDELKTKVESLRSQVDVKKDTAQKVDLGKISVEKSGENVKK